MNKILFLLGQEVKFKHILLCTLSLYGMVYGNYIALLDTMTNMQKRVGVVVKNLLLALEKIAKPLQKYFLSKVHPDFLEVAQLMQDEIKKTENYRMFEGITQTIGDAVVFI